MDDPVKIIFKYKNNHRHMQYHKYIFIGDIPANIMKILNNIKEKQLYESWIDLTQDEIKTLEKFYGNFWYKKFFNTYHMNFTIDNINENKQQEKALKDKFGDVWFNEHIKSFKLMDRKLFYTYETMIKDEMTKKEIKRRRTITEFEDEDINYKTIKSIKVKDMLDVRRPGRISGDRINGDRKEHTTSEDDVENKQDGGATHCDNQILHKINSFLEDKREEILMPRSMKLDDYVAKYVDQSGGDVKTIEEMAEEADEDEDNVIEFEEGIDDDDRLPDEELDINELDKLYQDNDSVMDKDIDKTTSLIKQALQNDKAFNKGVRKQIPFDTSKDNVTFDDLLKNVYVKNYITNQYIFKDDTVKTIKKKICASIANNTKFEKDPSIAPSRQYLWSEYYFNDTIEKVMIGQKWIKKSDILQIDIEPNHNIYVYESLRGNLKLLKDNIRRFGGKIKREDDDFNILYDYDGYYSNNEIFMIDVYNELGLGYSPDQEALKNVADVYIRIYFPRIKQDDVKGIIDYLNGDIKSESQKNANIFNSITNELIIENQIMFDVEKVKRGKNYQHLFKENFITQSVIHVNLRTLDKTKIDLFRVFNEFEMSDRYPFIQYQTIDGQIIFKYNEEDISEFSNSREKTDILTKWFENAPYGISFKVRIRENASEKFMAINLSDTGRVEYKTQWKEEDMATTNDIKRTYNYVRQLIEKINSEPNKVKLDQPDDSEFKYAFMNSIQRFELPEKFNINHNDLSEFSRYFFPYVALVIEPRKRQSKIKKESEKSKFGTYLRYKRVSKFENQARIEQRILYFIRNYEQTDQTLANEISKQFNITMERSLEEIERVRGKYPSIKQHRKTLKKVENIPKYKAPGIAIDIQGKLRDKYKIRISGARNKEQLDRMMTFMNILIYLYSETYLYKKPERQNLKERLKKLTDIAKRRFRVDDIVNYDKEIKTVKQMTALDKKRIGFKPEKGQNQWTRSCQNSGNDKRRRPQLMSQDEVVKAGFKLNKSTGIYEKTVTLKLKGKKPQQIVIKAVGLDSLDDSGNVTSKVFYSCNPDENDEHMYIGFLSRSNNPYDQCMPCCFKKDPSVSKNKEKKDYFMQCIGKGEKVQKPTSKTTGDKHYILQDTNKIQDNRFGFLPKYLDFLYNQTQNRTKKIKDHKLISSETGYFFKYGSKQESQPFLNALASLLDIEYREIIDKILNKLDKDKSDMIFTALNNGDIKSSFRTREKYMHYIKSSDNLSFKNTNHILSLPGIITPGGLNIIVYDKESVTVRKTLEKEKIRDDFSVVCQNFEEIDNIISPTRDTIMIVRENKNYYPIVMVLKDTDISKDLKVQKIFRYSPNPQNIVHHIKDFYIKNCQTSVVSDIEKNKKLFLTAKKAFSVLSESKNDDFIPQYQVVDSRFKCKYLITKNNTIVPVEPSGSIYNLQLLKNIDPKLSSFEESYSKLTKLDKAVDNKINIKPIGVFFDTKKKDDISVVGIMTELYHLVPIVKEYISLNKIKEKGLSIEYRQLSDHIDREIAKGKGNAEIDDRIEKVNREKYVQESYQLFRLNFSHYISKIENEMIKKRLERIINEQKISEREKQNKIRAFLFRLIDKNLLPIFLESIESDRDRSELSRLTFSDIFGEETIEQAGGKYEKFVHVLNKLPDLDNYEVNNNREICEINNSKIKCDDNIHCYWAYDNCYLGLIREMIIQFVNKMSSELIANNHKTFELLNREDYSVSDIADYNSFKEIKGQKVIKSTNNVINKTLAELLGKENVPKVGRKKSTKTSMVDIIEINNENQMQNMGDFFVQNIIEDSLSLFRAFANGYIWKQHVHFDLDNRNLGYYSDLQTSMSNYFRSRVIDWLIDSSNKESIMNNLAPYMDINKKNYIDEFINKMTKDKNVSTNGIVEYFILNKIYNIPILVYNKFNTLLFVIDNKIIDKNFENKYTNIAQLKNYINVRFMSMSISNIPIQIETAYYK